MPEFLPEFLLVLTTVPDQFDAAGLANALVEARLAACVSVLPPMISTYRWQGTLETASERQVLIKTTAASLDRLRVELHARHPYDVPEFLVVPIAGGSDAYLNWLRG